MHNLFVVRTPLQLLSAYIVAEMAQEKITNDLVLINPRGNSLWQGTYCLKRIVEDKDVWNNVIFIEHRIARRSKLFDLREQLGKLKASLLEPGKVDQIYLGSDRSFDNQLLVELVENKTYARLDDGLWSYSAPKRKRQDSCTMFLWSRIVKLLAAIDTGMQYNYRGGGYGQAATADYLFKPQLLQRSSPKAIAIPQDAICNSLKKITTGMPINNILCGEKEAIVFLGSVFVDQGLLNKDQELALLKTIAAKAKEKGMLFCYKPHPFEKKEKFLFYQLQIPEIKFIYFSDPIEIFFYAYPKIKTVISYSSSGLLYADLFSSQLIKRIALFKLFPPIKRSETIERIMFEAGVTIPDTKWKFEKLL